MGRTRIVDERVVSYKIAKQLKEAGFNERVLGIYTYTPSSSVCKGGYLNHYQSYVHHSNTEWQELFNGAKEQLCKCLDNKHPNISAPTYEQVLDWFQNKHRIIIYASFNSGWWHSFVKGEYLDVSLAPNYVTRQEAYDAAFSFVLRNKFNLK